MEIGDDEIGVITCIKEFYEEITHPVSFHPDSQPFRL